MGLDNKLIFPDFQTLTLDKDNPTAYYTREASGEIYRIDGRTPTNNVKINDYLENGSILLQDGSDYVGKRVRLSYFTVMENVKYDVIGITFNRLHFYDKNKKWLGSYDNSNIKINSFLTPSNAMYIRALLGDNTLTDVSQITNDIFINKAIINTGLLNTSTNKYDINITSSKDYTVGNILNKGYHTAIHSTRDYLYVKKIPVTPNKVYSFKRNPFNSQMNIYSFQNNEYGDGTLIKQFYSGYDTGSFTVPNNVEFITIAFLGGKDSIDTCYLQEGDEFVDYVQSSTKTISIEQPLRQANDNVYDSIYRFGDGGYYLFKRVGVRPYQDGDYDNPLVITDGVNTNYDLGIADYTEVQLTDFDPSIDFFGTDTTFNCDSMMPSIEVKVPIDYAYNESKRKYVDEEINIDTVDVDSRKNIEIVSIEGQTFENLLQEPLVQGTAINPVELTGRECVYTGGENTTVPVKEITGDTYINLLEDKIENTTIKPIASYNGDVVDGTRYKKEFIMNDMDTGMISRTDGITIEENSVWRFDPYYYKIKSMDLYIRFKASASTAICFYDIDKKFISVHSDSFNKTTETKLTIPQNAIFIRFCWHSGAGDGSYVIFDKIPYNLGDYDKVTIDEIRGNTKVYNEPIPIADPTTNLWTTGDPVLQTVDQDNAYGDTTKKQYLGTPTPIYIGNVPYNSQIFCYIIDSDGNKVNTTFSFRFYDKNMKYLSVSNILTGQGYDYTDTNIKYFLININGNEVQQTEGLYKVILTTNHITTFPTTYKEPTIIGVKTFPIQSVGELYVDENNKPILDNNSKEQYKIDVNSCSFPLSISKNNFIKHLIEGTLIYEFKDNVLKIRNETYYGNCNFKFHRNYIPKQLVDNILISNGRKILYLHVKGKITNLDYPSKKGGFLKIVGSYLNRAGTVYSTTYDTKSFEFDLNLKCEVYTDYDFNNLYFGVDLTDRSGNSNNSNFIHQEVEFYELGYHYMNVPYKTNTESILLPQPLRSVGDIKDRLYWDNENNKYCIEKNIEYLPQTSVKYSATPSAGWHKNAYMASKNVGQTAYFLSFSNVSKYKQDVPVISDSFNFIETVTADNTVKDFAYMYGNTGLLVSLDDNQDVKEWCSNNTINMNIILSTPEIVETNITELMTFSCYDNSTYIYTSRTSSHDEVNLPPIEELKGEITCTTLPLSTTAYIKPSTQYTMFMNTDCDVNYSLGGVEGVYFNKESIPTNLADPSIFMYKGYTLNQSNGELQVGSAHCVTNFIPFDISNNITMELKGDEMDWFGLFQYDENKVFINMQLELYPNQPLKAKITDRTRYIRMYASMYTINAGLIEVVTDRVFHNTFKYLMTTPKTLTNNTLTLLGEGNIGNVTLLEGDYTNSYVPDTFINDVFSVGELQEDGSYKVDIISKNKNLFVLSMDSIYDTFYVYNKVSKEDAVVIDNEEKTITFNGTDATQGIKVKNRLKKGHTYTIRFKIKWNSGRAVYGISFVNLVDSLGYKNPNEDSSRLNYSLKIDQDNVYVEVCKTFTLDTDRYLYLQMTTGNRSLSSMTVKDLEIIEGDIIDEKYSEGKEDIVSISLPQPLRRVGNVCDRFYWDKTRGKMCIEKNVAEIDFSNFDLSPCAYVSGRIQIIVPNIITGEGALICNSIKAYGTNHGDLHGDTTDSNGYIVGAVDVGSDKYIILRLGKGMTKDDSIQWLINHNTKIYHRIFPEIIETDITEPIEIDIFDTDTTITTASIVKPNMHLISDVLSRPVTIKSSTKYYVYANTTGDIEVRLGGAKIQYTSSDIVKEITTPSNVTENIIEFVGNCEVSNVMLRTDNRTDIKYFNGVIYASILQDDGNYKTTINIMSNNSEEYDSFINIITSSPLESGSKIVVVDNQFKLLKANGEYEDIVSTDGNVVIDSNCKKICSCGEVNGITSLIVPYRSVRPLKTPINISFNNYADNDNHTFVWDTDVGVEGHKFYYKDELVATIENPDPTYTYPSEMEGDVKIVAFNTLTESQGAVEDIITLPNRSEIVALNTIYDNGYKFTIVFNDNSNIRKGYKFIYSVDDGEENVIDIPVSDKAITLSQSIDVSEVSNNMKVRINSYNSVGEAEMKKKVFYLTPTPKWAYLLSSDNLMFRHQDKFPFTTYYKIKATNTQTLEEKEYNYGSNQGINGLIIDYLLKSNREEELSIMLTMNDGYLDHVPCVPFKVSKTLDLSLVAPQNFTMEWVGDGVAKFSWDDNYTNEDYFEFVYSLNGGIEEVVKIYPDDVAGTGGRVSYTYKFDGFGILTGRVRMVWELNTSEYTDSKTATFVAVTGLPPAWIVKEYSGDNLVITWEAQSYVDHYEIMIECDGEVEILTEKKDMFYLDLKKYHGKYVSISIKTHFTTGLVTEYSDSILFKPVSTSGITNQMTYAPIKVEKDDNVSVYTKLADRYTSYQRITGLVTNSNLLYNKFCKDMLTNSASFNNVFYHLVNHEYKDFVSVKTDNVSIESLIRILNYAHINQDGHLNTFVYTPITSSHTDFVDIQKVTIVCIGDSITAGHPHFWAESMTGDIESQYPYWLSKRLNNVYDVINKGFGSDRTYNVLARFKADVLDLNPQYCIIQAGTNDIYWGQAETDGDYSKFDKTLESMKNNIKECVQLCLQNGIVPIIGNLIPRTQAVTIPMVKYGLVEFNKWIADYANNTEGVSYIDFFNAGKDSIPPTPLEDPKNPYALNPIYDGKELLSINPLNCWKALKIIELQHG